jgi:peptidoglycan/xylan/chitin deacetylase (PgdA/CDA1 family)
MRRFIDRFRSRSVILAYHRVADLGSDPQLLSVSLKHFAQQLEFLRNHYLQLSLVELGNALRKKDLPKHSVAVTFDDGYADNSWNAKPLLEQHNVPATIFVTAGYVGKDDEFWWDDLERIILLTGHLPKELSLKIDNKTYEWNLTDEDLSSLSGWHFFQDANPGSRQKIYKDLYFLLGTLDDQSRKGVLSQLRVWANVPETGRPGYRALNSNELRILDQSRSIQIGAHTMTHSSFAIQSLEQKKKEILGSKRLLENLLNHPVEVFSYPFGGREAIDREVLACVEEAGFKLACANYPASVFSDNDPFLLPRYIVRNWGQAEFARHLEEWFSE